MRTFWTKFSFVAGGILILGLTIFGLGQRESARKLSAQNERLRQQLDQLSGEYEDLSKRISQARTDPALRDDRLTEVLRLRNEVSTLRRLTNAPKTVEHARVSDNVSVSYDPEIWKPHSSSEGSSVRRMTWELPGDDWIQITVASHTEHKDENDFKRQLMDAQTMRGSPAEFVAERHETWGGCEWLVLELRNAHNRPPRLETSYFRATDAGYTTLFVVGEEASFSTQRAALEGFLSQITVK